MADAKGKDDTVPTYSAEFWQQELEREGRRGGNAWRKRAKTTVNRYRDERASETGNSGKIEQHGKRFNIFYSNVETLKPAISARTPIPAVARRFKGEDDTTRIAGEIIQTALSFAIDDYDFDIEKEKARDDGLIAGRGVLRVDYKAKIVRRTPKLASASSLPDAAAPPAMAPPGFGPAGGVPMAPPMGLLAAPGGPPAALGAPQAPPGPMGAPMMPPGPQMSPTALPAGGPLPPVAQALRAVPGAPGAGEPMSAPTEAPEQEERYEIDGRQVKPDGIDDETNEPYVDEVVEETVRAHHVLWRDFRHTPVADWSRVWWVAFAEYLTRYEAEKEYGKDLAGKLSYKPADDDSEDKDDDQYREPDRALIWKIWCKRTKKVHHIAEGLKDQVLKDEPVPFEVEGFFPVAPPWRPVGTTDRWEPIPEYCVYQDQAEEIDAYTDRINALTNAIEAKGAAPGPVANALQIVKNQKDGTVAPVEDFETVMEHGGFEKAIAWMPIERMATVVKILSERRMQSKQELYEITGISDLVRQSTAASETATAQQLKSNFGTMRMQPRQLPFERFVRDTLRIMAQVMSKKFSPRTLERMTGIPLAVTNPQRHPDADRIIELLRDDELRAYRIDVETDSMIQPDEQAEKAAVVEFVGSIAKYLQAAVEVGGADPLLMPLLMEMLKSACRRFKLGRELEDVIDKVVEAHEKAAQVKAQQPPPEDPAVVEAKAKAALEQQKEQARAAEAQAEAQRKAAESAAEARRKDAEAAAKAELQQREFDHKRMLEEQDAAHRRNIEAQKAITEATQREHDQRMSERDMTLKEAGDMRARDDHAAKMEERAAKKRVQDNQVATTGAERGAAETGHAAQQQFLVAIQQLTELLAHMRQPRRMSARKGPDGAWVLGDVPMKMQ